VDEKIFVYIVSNDVFRSTVAYDNYKDALIEIDAFMEDDPEMTQKITLEVAKMTRTEFEALAEFEGY
jgi:antitoxin component HigA of HigAB toxin-antitoxin module